MIGLYHNLRHLGKILRVLCGISYGRDVKPAFRIKGGSIYELTETLQTFTGKPLSACTNQELYLALLELVRRKSADRVQPVKGRKLYYISAEFLIGKLLSNNLINLGLYDEARDALAAAGKSLAEIEEVEPERPSATAVWASGRLLP